MPKRTLAQLAFQFVLIVGIANLFADFTYEGARSVNGAFLGSLGASPVVVGFVAGFGELIGYALRSVFGFFTDKTHKYWAFALSGYAINMLAVPALALAGNWPLAALLMIAERTGRAIRKPAMETMLSFAGRELGSGWVFGLNEFLDQFGATVGPLVVAWILFLKGDFKIGYAALLISAVLCLAVIVVAGLRFPRPHELEAKEAVVLEATGFHQSYWLLALAGALIAAGFADFSLIAFHFQTAATFPAGWIPVFYAIAMATAGVSALAFGWLLDRFGRRVVMVAFFLGAWFAPFVFLGGFTSALVGMILFGFGLGAQGALLKAVVATMVTKAKRSTAFGVFDTVFGIAWFLGSAVMGVLYGKSIVALMAFSMILQFAALPAFAVALKRGPVRDR